MCYFCGCDGLTLDSYCYLEAVLVVRHPGYRDCTPPIPFTPERQSARYYDAIAGFIQARRKNRQKIKNRYHCTAFCFVLRCLQGQSGGDLMASPSGLQCSLAVHLLVPNLQLSLPRLNPSLNTALRLLRQQSRRRLPWPAAQGMRRHRQLLLSLPYFHGRLCVLAT